MITPDATRRNVLLESLLLRRPCTPNDHHQMDLCFNLEDSCTVASTDILCHGLPRPWWVVTRCTGCRSARDAVVRPSLHHLVSVGRGRHVVLLPLEDSSARAPIIPAILRASLRRYRSKGGS